jgi:hypothetical protein
MSDELNVVVEESEEEALAAAMAGYTNARAGTTAPAAAPAESHPPADATPADTSSDTLQQPEADDAQKPTPVAQPNVDDVVDGLKAQVRAMAPDSDPDAVRKLFGEIGTIKKMLLEQQKATPAPAPTPAAPPPTAPADDELAAALKEAETAAQDFPELTGPLAKAMQLLAQRTGTAAPAMSAEEISALTARAAAEAQQRVAIEALAEEHPDFETVRSTPEFKTWFASKPQEYQDRLQKTWNPVVVSRGLSEFKASLASTQQAAEKKQKRLADAVTPPRGSAANTRQSTIPDEDGAAIGYAAVRGNRFPKR